MGARYRPENEHLKTWLPFCEGCNRRFTPASKGRRGKTCSDRCRLIAWRRSRETITPAPALQIAAPALQLGARKPQTALQRLGIQHSVQEGLTWHGRTIDTKMRDYLLACQADEDLVNVLRKRLAQLTHS